MSKLRISDDISLPLEAVTQTFAILAKRGAGKTNTSVVLTEEMLDEKQPVCVVDPVGVWWGLKSSKDGKSPGYSVVIFGGEHADLPLLEGAGVVIADFLVDNRVPAVLDLSLLSKGASRRFMKDFAERLYQKNRDPLHLVVDEADAFIPQRIDHGMEPLVGAINDIVRRGRARGLGVTLISQRPALVNKDVLTQVECLVVLKMTGPHDRDAIERWVEYNAEADQGQTVLASLQELAIGDAWVWSPGWLRLFKRTHIRERRTFDSSATPAVGQKLRPPKAVAEVDLEALREKMADTVAEAEKNDPKALRAQVAQLRRELEGAKEDRLHQSFAQPVETELSELHAKVDALEAELTTRTVPDWAMTTIRGLSGEVGRCAGELAKVSNDLQTLSGLVAKACAAIDAAAGEKSTGVRRISSPQAYTTVKTSNGAAHRPVRVARVSAADAPAAPKTAEPDGEPPTNPQRKILAVLAQYPDGLDKVRLAILLGQAHGGGSFNNNLGRLRSQGWAVGDRNEPIRITKAGLRFGPFEELPAGSDLLKYWLDRLDKCPRIILQVLSDAYPKTLTKEEVAARSSKYNNGEPYEPGGGSFNNSLGKLRTLQLINRGKDIAASPNLFG